MTTPNNPENPDNAKNPFSSDSTGKLPSYGEATSKANEEHTHDANNYGVDNTAHDHASHDAYGTDATALAPATRPTLVPAASRQRRTQLLSGHWSSALSRCCPCC